MPRSFNRNEVMMMDRFVHTLSGEQEESIMRDCMSNTLSMLENSLTLHVSH